MIKHALIADIQRASLHDGPGYRTTVFFKGCPLHCQWCHNPECISSEIQTLFYKDKCIGCKMCDKGCYSGARVICGKYMTSDELVSEIKLDLPYYKNGGGVTFSGGEPLMQADFLYETIEKCSKLDIGCAVETSLAIFDKRVLSNMKLIMADFKIWDTNTHKQYIGIGNEAIKENFIRLNELGLPIIARTPIIPEIEQGIDKISEFLKSLNNVFKYELLPYHFLGMPKYEALGLKSPAFSVPDSDYMKELNKYAFNLR